MSDSEYENKVNKNLSLHNHKTRIPDNESIKRKHRESRKEKSRKERIDISKVKERKLLDEDFKLLKQCIIDGSLETFREIISNEDNKWYLENNDLDYELFVHAIMFRRMEFIKEMEILKYHLNPNLLLIEVYVRYIKRKYKETISFNPKERKRHLLSTENLKYLITNHIGINQSNCILEFYFLLMAFEYDPAVKLLSTPFAEKLRDRLNETFIGDENNLLEQLLYNNDIVKEAICSALERKLDGVAFEIYTFTGIFLDEKILRCAIKGDCSFFLEEVWESTRKFGNIKNFYAPKISFSKYISVMLDEGKFEMASEAIKNWFEAYKEENVFEILVNKNEELAM